jgi:hypothetical protein
MFPTGKAAELWWWLCLFRCLIHSIQVDRCSHKTSIMITSSSKEPFQKSITVCYSEKDAEAQIIF